MNCNKANVMWNKLLNTISESIFITKLLMNLPDKLCTRLINCKNRTLEKLTHRLILEETNQIQKQDLYDNYNGSSTLSVRFVVKFDPKPQINWFMNNAIEPFEQNRNMSYSKVVKHLQLQQFNLQRVF
ncbi:Uncharacterized protein FWK35_00005467 [Aphis craccivora]|uniref:Uncharacterized protein n=1 Tax=Aphis craccivora TaxID=307492 RepID=A0A6G0ZJG1_APHCR|nr:Uncharacterized protein FWK35_00005467 [Aphis craccivora]